VIRKLVAVVALSTVGLIPLGPVEAGPNRCHKWVNSFAGPGFTTVNARCNSVQNANNMFRVRARIFRKSDGEFFTVRGPWRSCDGDVSRQSWITDLYIFISYRFVVSVDTVRDGC